MERKVNQSARIKSLSIRIDSELLDQLHCLANYNGRSANSEILQLIRKAVCDFEKECGPFLKK